MDENVETAVKAIEESSMDKVIIMGTAALAGIVAKVYVEKGIKIALAAFHARKASSPE